MRLFGRSIALVSLLAAAAAVAHAPDARACTTFESRGPSGMLVAKSFDWATGEGWIVVNERGRARAKLVPGGAPDVASWTGRLASVSFTTVGVGFPISGMNEAGLTIEALVDLSVAPSVTPDPARLTGLELVQYGLDRFDSAADLADFAEGHGFSQLAVPLHFFACDRSGACVVIESRGAAGDARAIRGAELGVHALANQPFLVDASAAARSPSSPDRFAVVARGVEAGRARDVDDAFRLLDRARIPGLTKWQLVWDVERGTVHFRDRPGAPTEAVHVDWAGVRCEGAPRVRAIGRASASSPLFAAWTADDAARTEGAVAAQVRVRSPAARRLASEVAASTRATRCE